MSSSVQMIRFNLLAQNYREKKWGHAHQHHLYHSINPYVQIPELSDIFWPSSWFSDPIFSSGRKHVKILPQICEDHMKIKGNPRDPQGHKDVGPPATHPATPKNHGTQPMNSLSRMGTWISGVLPTYPVVFLEIHT